jgi:probable addiction module antidote protein
MATPLKIQAFDAAQFLDTDEAIAAYLADALDSGDSSVFQEALQTAARARGMSGIAEASGLGRESLYKALRPDAMPRFETVQKVISALGVTLKITTRKKRSRSLENADVVVMDIKSERMPRVAGAVIAQKARKEAAKSRTPRGKMAS